MTSIDKIRAQFQSNLDATVRHRDKAAVDAPIRTGVILSSGNYSDLVRVYALYDYHTGTTYTDAVQAFTGLSQDRSGLAAPKLKRGDHVLFCFGSTGHTGKAIILGHLPESEKGQFLLSPDAKESGHGVPRSVEATQDPNTILSSLESGEASVIFRESEKSGQHGITLSLNGVEVESSASKQSQIHPSDVIPTGKEIVAKAKRDTAQAKKQLVQESLNAASIPEQTEEPGEKPLLFELAPGNQRIRFDALSAKADLQKQQAAEVDAEKAQREHQEYQACMEKRNQEMEKGLLKLKEKLSQQALDLLNSQLPSWMQVDAQFNKEGGISQATVGPFSMNMEKGEVSVNDTAYALANKGLSEVNESLPPHLQLCLTEGNVLQVGGSRVDLESVANGKANLDIGPVSVTPGENGPKVRMNGKAYEMANRALNDLNEQLPQPAQVSVNKSENGIEGVNVGPVSVGTDGSLSLDKGKLLQPINSLLKQFLPPPATLQVRPDFQAVSLPFATYDFKAKRLTVMGETVFISKGKCEQDKTESNPSLQKNAEETEPLDRFEDSTIPVIPRIGADGTRTGSASAGGGGACSLKQDRMQSGSRDRDRFRKSTPEPDEESPYLEDGDTIMRGGGQNREVSGSQPESGDGQDSTNSNGNKGKKGNFRADIDDDRENEVYTPNTAQGKAQTVIYPTRSVPELETASASPPEETGPSPAQSNGQPVALVNPPGDSTAPEAAYRPSDYPAPAFDREVVSEVERRASPGEQRYLGLGLLLKRMGIQNGVAIAKHLKGWLVDDSFLSLLSLVDLISQGVLSFPIGAMKADFAGEVPDQLAEAQRDAINDILAGKTAEERLSQATAFSSFGLDQFLDSPKALLDWAGENDGERSTIYQDLATGNIVSALSELIYRKTGRNLEALDGPYERLRYQARRAGNRYPVTDDPQFYLGAKDARQKQRLDQSEQEASPSGTSDDVASEEPPGDVASEEPKADWQVVSLTVDPNYGEKQTALTNGDTLTVTASFSVPVSHMEVLANPAVSPTRIPVDGDSLQQPLTLRAEQDVLANPSIPVRFVPKDSDRRPISRDLREAYPMPVLVDNKTPRFQNVRVQYPPGQFSLKGDETATIVYDAVNADTVAVSSQSFTVVSSQSGQVSIRYNGSQSDFRGSVQLTATRKANGSESLRSVTVTYSDILPALTAPEEPVSLLAGIDGYVNEIPLTFNRSVQLAYPCDALPAGRSIGINGAGRNWRHRIEADLDDYSGETVLKYPLLIQSNAGLATTVEVSYKIAGYADYPFTIDTTQTLSHKPPEKVLTVYPPFRLFWEYGTELNAVASVGELDQDPFSYFFDGQTLTISSLFRDQYIYGEARFLIRKA